MVSLVVKEVRVLVRELSVCSICMSWTVFLTDIVRAAEPTPIEIMSVMKRFARILAFGNEWTGEV